MLHAARFELTSVTKLVRVTAPMMIGRLGRPPMPANPPEVKRFGSQV
jgi:hypothetical protein